MAFLNYQELDINAMDCTTNPEILLLMAEQDEAECDATESRWLAGQAVTPPKQSND
ncbi:MAG: hypothetical protein QFB87_05065 [Patescibacteria group bacterium]|nr:hypothetical protein [Patescibacteria group bacterium]